MLHVMSIETTTIAMRVDAGAAGGVPAVAAHSVGRPGRGLRASLMWGGGLANDHIIAMEGSITIGKSAWMWGRREGLRPSVKYTWRKIYMSSITSSSRSGGYSTGSAHTIYG